MMAQFCTLITFIYLIELKVDFSTSMLDVMASGSGHTGPLRDHLSTQNMERFSGPRNLHRTCKSLNDALF